jgi:protein required for attachment to host cells
MKKTSIGTGDWVVVCDGRKALILENRGDEKFPNLHTKETYEHPDLPTHMQGSAPPGTSHQSVGHHRSSVRQTDWHDQAERSFLHDFAKRLDQAVLRREVTGLTLIASPRALGMIREAYTSAIRGALVREIAKDVVKFPVHEIERMVCSEDVA